MIKINEHSLCIDIDELLNSITSVQNTHVVQSLACRNDVIKHVMDQVFDTYTVDGYRGSTSSTTYEPWCPLDIFRRNIAKCASDIAKEEIEKLEAALKNKDEEVRRALSHYSLRAMF